MQQDQDAPPELEALEGEYALDPKKMLALGIFVLALALVASFIQPFIFPIRLAGLPFAFSFAVFFLYCLVGAGTLLAFFSLYRDWRMSLYTNGFIYLNRNKHRVIYWQQVTSVHRVRGAFYIFIRDEKFIIVPSLISHYGALRARITRESTRSHD